MTEAQNAAADHEQAKQDQIAQADQIDTANATKPDETQKDLVEEHAQAAPAEAPQPSSEVTASDPGLTVVPAPPSAVAPGADIVDHSLQPLPGEQPGVVADTPVAANTAADPHPELHQPPPQDPNAVKPQTADDPIPEQTSDGASKPLAAVVNTVAPPPAFADKIVDPASTDVVAEDAAEVEDDGPYAGLHPSQTPPGVRPTPAGPSSHPRTRDAKYGR